MKGITIYLQKYNETKKGVRLSESQQCGASMGGWRANNKINLRHTLWLCWSEPGSHIVTAGRMELLQPSSLGPGVALGAYYHPISACVTQHNKTETPSASSTSLTAVMSPTSVL